jgi:RimJ/RimL family protein N-acetyltransferase
MEPPLLVTERLVLRPAHQHDLPWLYSIWTSPSLRPHFWGGRVISLEEAHRTLETCISFGREQGLGLWVIHLLDERPIGFCGFWPRADERRPDCLIGLEPHFRGYGLAVEACGRMVDYAFERDLAEEISACCEAANLKSQALLLRLGMEALPARLDERESVRRFRLTPALRQAAVRSQGECAVAGALIARPI